MTAIALPRKRVLADVIPGGLVRDLALVLGGSAFVGLLAQFSIPLPSTPVPLTLGTFAVLLTGAALGPVRGLLSIGIYRAAGMAGVPWFAGNASGYGFRRSATSSASCSPAPSSAGWPGTAPTARP